MVQKGLAAHYQALPHIAPDLSAYDLTPGDPHDDPILLPSSFTCGEVTSLHLQELADIELRLRVGHGHDILERLRKALGVRSLFTRQARNTHGYRGNTRSQEAIRRAQSEVNSCARLYRRVFKGITALNAPNENLLGLQELQNSDLVMLSDWVEDKLYQGSNRQPLPWIWRLLSTPLTAEHTGPDLASKVEYQGNGEEESAEARAARMECMQVVEQWNKEGPPFALFRRSLG